MDGLSCPGFLRPLGQKFFLLLGLVAPKTTGQDFVFLFHLSSHSAVTTGLDNPLLSHSVPESSARSVLNEMVHVGMGEGPSW